MNIQITQHWNGLLETFQPAERDIYFREEYVRLYETESEKAMCCIATEEEKVMLFPFLCRSFDYKGKTLHDFETAYGYGGPCVSRNS